MTAFAATFISDKLIADTQREDSQLAELALQLLISDVRNIERIEALTDAQIEAEIAETESSYRYFADERDWNEAESARVAIYELEAVLEHREELRAQAAAELAYMDQPPLTHTPFAGLGRATHILNRLVSA